LTRLVAVGTDYCYGMTKLKHVLRLERLIVCLQYKNQLSN